MAISVATRFTLYFLLCCISFHWCGALSRFRLLPVRSQSSSPQSFGELVFARCRRLNRINMAVPGTFGDGAHEDNSDNGDYTPLEFVKQKDVPDDEDSDDEANDWNTFFTSTGKTNNGDAGAGMRDVDLFQNRDLDLILTERATRFYDPKLLGVEKEKCILVAVDKKLEERRANARALVSDATPVFTLKESLNELSELVGTAGLQVMGCCIQRLYTANSRTYVGSGKVVDIMAAVNATGAKTLVIDDDLTPKQQRNLEDALASCGGANIKVLDRTAVILEIFAQHAKSREGQLQVELAMLEYRLTRGPRASGGEGDSGAGFRGPGETKLETDKRVIKDKIVLLQREISTLGSQRDQHRKSRMKLGLPVVALVGYTNAGKSTLLNRLSRAGVLAENMLFATLDPTTRRVQLPRSRARARAAARRTTTGTTTSSSADDDKNDADGDFGDAGENSGGNDDADDDDDNVVEANTHGVRNKGQEVLLTDTVGFISKLPTDLIAAFRATLEEVSKADILIHVIDRSSIVWDKQRETVLRELDAIGCTDTPIVEMWNKIDNMEDPDEVRMEAMCVPMEVEAIITTTTETPIEGSSSAAGDQSLVSSSVSATATAAAAAASNGDKTVFINGSEVVIGDSSRGGGGGGGGGQFDDVTAWDKESWTKTAQELRTEKLKTIKEEDSYVWSDDDDYVRGGPPEGSEHDDTVEETATTTRTTTARDATTGDDDEKYETGDDGRELATLTEPPTGTTVRRSSVKRIRPARKTFTVAASAKTGDGFDDFLETLESALSLLLKTIDVFVPFNEDDGIIAMIHSQGVVDAVDYNNIGTSLTCRVPPALYSRLQKFRVKKSSSGGGKAAASSLKDGPW